MERKSADSAIKMIVTLALEFSHKVANDSRVEALCCPLETVLPLTGFFRIYA